MLTFQDQRSIQALTSGRICSYYYLKHQTVGRFQGRLQPELRVQELLSLLAVRFCCFLSSLSSAGTAAVCSTLSCL